MKNVIKLIVVGWLLAMANPVAAQLSKQCATCFTSQITKATPHENNCTDYEMEVSYTGHCEHALSHFTVAIPTCATVSTIKASTTCAIIKGLDPTTGLTGFKIDNLSGFGDDSYSHDDDDSKKKITVSFTLCQAQCSNLSCWQPVIAYKAGNCFELDTVQHSCPSSLKAHLIGKNPTCAGSANGEVTAVIDAGVSPYKYSWSNGDTTSTTTGLPAGLYSVVIKDNTGATDTLNTELLQPSAISITSNVINATCNGQSNGLIDISVSGGTLPYSYTWSNGASTEDLDSLKAGVYTITVQDTLGCQAQASISVQNTKQLSLSFQAVPPGCGQSNGSLTVTVSGGTAPYSFLWSTGATTSDISGVMPGTYTLIVTDAEGCTVSSSYSLRESNTLNLGYSVTPTSCLDDGSGAVNLSVSGGTPPYSFTWSNGATTEDINSLTVGIYTVVVTDSLGCQVTAHISVYKNSFAVNSQIVQPKCAGDNTGSIALTPMGGVDPYTYLWSNGATTSSINQLAPGNYTVTITDSAGCSKLMVFTITKPSPLTVTDTVTTVSCGVYGIDLAVTGGVAPYTYLWSTGAQTSSLNNVVGDTYSVSITDTNGCTLTHTVALDSTVSWSCGIAPPATAPSCLSANNKIYSTLPDGSSYQWQVTSTDNSWLIQSGATSDTLVYTAGNANSSATFQFTIIKNGCTQTCSFTQSTCTSSGNTGGDNDETCEDCFSSSISRKEESSGGCITYTVTLSTDGNCRYELSHVVVDIPCGDISNYSSTGQWPLVIGKDPTTGLTGLKADNTNGFGKELASFQVTFTVCSSGDCLDQLEHWNPVIGYKAGQCIAYDTLSPDDQFETCSYPNPFNETVHVEVTCESDDFVAVDIYDMRGKHVGETMTSPMSCGEKKTFVIDGSSMNESMYIYRVQGKNGSKHGKILKRQ